MVFRADALLTVLSILHPPSLHRKLHLLLLTSRLYVAAWLYGCQANLIQSLLVLLRHSALLLSFSAPPSSHCGGDSLVSVESPSSIPSLNSSVRLLRRSCSLLVCPYEAMRPRPARLLASAATGSGTGWCYATLNNMKKNEPVIKYDCLEAEEPETGGSSSCIH